MFIFNEPLLLIESKQTKEFYLGKSNLIIYLFAELIIIVKYCYLFLIKHDGVHKVLCI